jgi:hypothetical protein
MNRAQLAAPPFCNARHASTASCGKEAQEAGIAAPGALDAALDAAGERAAGKGVAGERADLSVRVTHVAPRARRAARVPNSEVDARAAEAAPPGALLTAAAVDAASALAPTDRAPAALWAAAAPAQLSGAPMPIPARAVGAAAGKRKTQAPCVTTLAAQKRSRVTAAAVPSGVKPAASARAPEARKRGLRASRAPCTNTARTVAAGAAVAAVAAPAAARNSRSLAALAAASDAAAAATPRAGATLERRHVNGISSAAQQLKMMVAHTCNRRVIDFEDVCQQFQDAWKLYAGEDSEQRRRILHAALAFVRLPPVRQRGAPLSGKQRPAHCHHPGVGAARLPPQA